MKIEDTDAPLESLLTSVPLREPSDELDARVNATLASHALRQPPPALNPRRFSIHRLAIAAGILIALGIGIRLSIPTANQQPKQIAVFTPVQRDPIRIERDTTTLFDDGIIPGNDETTYQKVRRRTVREIWYIDPTTHAQVLMTIPTEQVMIEKVDTF